MPGTVTSHDANRCLFCGRFAVERCPTIYQHRTTELRQIRNVLILFRNMLSSAGAILIFYDGGIFLSGQIQKAVLLEGSPGVGKTSLISALATATGHEVSTSIRTRYCSPQRWQVLLVFLSRSI